MKRKTTLDKIPSDRIQKWVNYAAIIGLAIAIISLGFTFWFSAVTYRFGETANDLAKKSLELSQNDSTQAKQLEKLTALYENSEKLLIKVTNQNDLLIAQLNILNRHYRLDSKSAGNNEKANSNGLVAAIDEVNSMGRHLEEEEGIWDYDLFAGFVNKIEEQLNKNTYLISQRDWAAEWAKMRNVSMYTYARTDSLNSGLPVNTHKGLLKIQTEANAAEAHKEFFDYFKNEFHNFQKINQRELEKRKW